MEELAFLVLRWLLELVVQALLEGVLGVLWDLASSTYKATYGRENHDPIVAAIGYSLLGALLGGASLFIWPDRIFEAGPIPGVSLLVSPLGAGLAMHAWGSYRRNRGHVTTNLATFLGGAAFAIGTALVRFIWAN